MSYPGEEISSVPRNKSPEWRNPNLSQLLCDIGTAALGVAQPQQPGELLGSSSFTELQAILSITLALLYELLILYVWPFTAAGMGERNHRGCIWPIINFRRSSKLAANRRWGLFRL